MLVVGHTRSTRRVVGRQVKIHPGCSDDHNKRVCIDQLSTSSSSCVTVHALKPLRLVCVACRALQVPARLVIARIWVSGVAFLWQLGSSQSYGNVQEHTCVLLKCDQCVVKSLLKHGNLKSDWWIRSSPTSSWGKETSRQTFIDETWENLCQEISLSPIQMLDDKSQLWGQQRMLRSLLGFPKCNLSLLSFGKTRRNSRISILFMTYRKTTMCQNETRMDQCTQGKWRHFLHFWDD